MSQVSMIKILVRGHTMGFTCKDSRTPHLAISWMGTLIERFRALGFSRDDIEVRVFDENDRRLEVADWWVAQYGDSEPYLDFILQRDCE